MRQCPKKIKKQLRELNYKAYEEELNRELSKLHGKFGQWKSKEIDAVGLSDEIHNFHSEISRKLFAEYNDGQLFDVNVASAIRRGILNKEEIPTEIMETLQWCFPKENSKGEK